MLLMQELCFKNFTTVLYQKHFLSVRKLDLKTFKRKNPKVRDSDSPPVLAAKRPRFLPPYSFRLFEDFVFSSLIIYSIFMP